MKKKILKILKITVIIMIIIALVFSLVISQNGHHLEICHEEHCAFCTIIQIAKNIISLYAPLYISIIIGALIHIFLSRLRIEKYMFIQSSLVLKKVQLNE